MPIKAEPKDREAWAVLPAMTPLPVRVIEKPKQRKSTFEDSNDQIKLHVEVVDGPFAHQYQGKPSKMNLFLGLTMGSTNDGRKSMLRQLVEAIFGPLDDAQAYALDLETALMGQTFIMVGNYKDPNAEQLRLKPVGFSRYDAATFASQQTGGVAPPAANGAAADPYQYTPDRAYRWKEGMANWEPVPPPAAPPPPPAAPPPMPQATAPPPAVTPPPVPAGTQPPAPGAPKIDF